MSKIIDCSALTCYLCLSIIILTLSIVSYVKIQNSSYKFIQGIGDNWNQGPIQTIIPRDGSCQMGEVVLIDDYWPGTVQGCDCSTSSNSSLDKLKRGTCSRDSRRSSTYYCRDIKPVDPIRYTTWEGKTLCGRRINSSYLDLKIAVNDDSCPSGTRSCGVVDTKDNVLCVSQEASCPVNKIVILDSSESVPTDFNYVTYNLDNGKKLAYTTENTLGEIVHEFKVSQLEPCLDTSYYNYAREPYKLSNAYGKDECPALSTGDTTDPRLELVDSDSYNNFNEMNGVLQVLLQLPLYQLPPSSLKINLYSKEYYGLSLSCREEIKNIGQSLFMKNLVTFEDHIDSSTTMVLVLLIIMIVEVLFCIGVYFFIACMPEHDGLSISFYFNLCLYAVGLLSLIFASLAAHKTNSLPKDYVILTNDGCGDWYTDAIVTEFYNTFGKANNINLANAIIAGIFTVFPVIFNIIGMVDRSEK